MSNNQFGAEHLQAPVLSVRGLISQLEATGNYRVSKRLTSLPRVGSTSRPVALVAVIDTETTGLNPVENKVLDIGVIRMEVDAQTGEFIRIVDTWEAMEDPGQPIPAEIIALTGITDEMVRGRKFNERELADVMNGVSLVIAHGAVHDRRFLEARFPWFENLAWGCSLDQVSWAQEGFGSAKLEFIAFRCGYFYDAHRALVDCHALARCMVECNLPSSGQTVLKQLIDLCDVSDYRIYANGAPFERKDQLKNRGYRWDGDARLWHKTLRGPELVDEEFQWMREELYGRSTRVQIETIDAYVKYSGRQGVIEWRSIGAQGDSMRTASEGLAGAGQRLIP